MNLIANAGSLGEQALASEAPPIELPAEMHERIQAVYSLIGDYLGVTQAEFADGFTLDAASAAELNIWCHIAAVWLAYHEKFCSDWLLPLADERNLIASLILISTSVETPSRLPVSRTIAKR